MYVLQKLYFECTMQTASQQGRIQSIDTLRGITILVMIFVNELVGVSNIPWWMKHLPADVDGMTFVDMVFPSFLFIVGMSIPFALDARIKKGDSFWQLQWHIGWRSVGLLVMGVFMVNGEGGTANDQAMGMPIALWLFLFYGCIILVWNVYRLKNRTRSLILRAIGIIGLVVLAMVYRSGEDGSGTLTPKWWGILGLIGWAYLYSCLLFQVFRKNLIAMMVLISVCIGFYIIAKTGYAKENLSWMNSQAGHAAHTSIVISGIILSKIFFDDPLKPVSKRFLQTAIFAIILFIVGYFLRPYFKISKIYATPTWCLYCAATSCLLFAFLYWLIDIKGMSGWTRFFKPAATNPLLTYIIPGIMYALFSFLSISVFPDSMRYGLPGILWSLFFAVLVMYLAIGFNKINIKLQL